MCFDSWWCSSVTLLQPSARPSCVVGRCGACMLLALQTHSPLMPCVVACCLIALGVCVTGLPFLSAFYSLPRQKPQLHFMCGFDNAAGCMCGIHLLALQLDALSNACCGSCSYYDGHTGSAWYTPRLLLCLPRIKAGMYHPLPIQLHADYVRSMSRCVVCQVLAA